MKVIKCSNVLALQCGEVVMYSRKQLVFLSKRMLCNECHTFMNDQSDETEKLGFPASFGDMSTTAKAGEKLLLALSSQRNTDVSIPENIDKPALTSRISIILGPLHNLTSLLENDFFVYNRIMYKNSRQHRKMQHYQKMKEVRRLDSFLNPQFQKRIKKYKIIKPEKLLLSIQESLTSEFPILLQGYGYQ